MSGRPATPFDGVRKAAYTDHFHTEIHLTYPHEGNENDANNGKKSHAFYPTLDYLARQAKHGKDVYPDPTPHSL